MARYPSSPGVCRLPVHRLPLKSTAAAHLLLAAAVGLGISACFDDSSPASGGGGGPLSTYPAPDTLGGGEVIAEVGSVLFTTDEIERRLARLSPYVRAQFQQPDQLERWVTNEIRKEAIAQQAWKEGLHKSPEVLERIRAILVETYTKKAMMERSASLEPNDKELIEAYKAREDEFNRPAKVRLSQIVRYVDSKAERKKATKLLQGIKKSVVDGTKKNDHTVFGRSAKEHSQDDATKLGAGDLQFLSRQELADRYGEAVAQVSFEEAKVGDLYVADAPNAVVLFKKTGRRREVKRTFEQVRSQLRGVLAQQKRQLQFEAWSKNIFDETGVSLNKEAIQKVEVPKQGAPAPIDPRSTDTSP